MSKLARWLAPCLATWPAVGSTQVELVRDINTQVVAQSSSPFFLGTVSAGAVFLARSAEGNPMLWRSDGTAAGTIELVADLTGTVDQPGLQLSGRVLFFETAANGSRRVWATDGSASGTRVLVDNTSINGASLVGLLGSRLAVLNIVPQTTGVPELWVTDGTPGGTRMVRAPSTALSGTGQPTASVNGRLFFYGSDQATGAELWVTDGTAAGTRLVADVRPGPDGSNPIVLGTQGNDVYFTVETAAGPLEIWRASSVTGVAARFAGETGFPGFPGREQFKGAPNGFYYVADGDLWFNPAVPGLSVRVRDFNPSGDDGVEMLGFVGNRLVLRARSATSGANLWSTDGTSAGTVLVRDLSPGAPDTGIAAVESFGASLIVSLVFENGNAQQWWSDGTSVGTRRIFSDPQSELGSGPYVYFDLLDSPTPRVWRVNVATGAAQAQLVAGLTQVGSVVRTPDRTVFFGCTLGTVGFEPCFSDGTSAGTRVLRDIVPQVGNDSSGPRELTRVGSFVYFVADDGVHGAELWRTDGTAQGTTLVRDIMPGPSGSEPTRLIALGNILYFQANDGIHGREPWRTDGTAAGTLMLRDINSGPASSSNDFGHGTECSRWAERQGSSVVFVAWDGSSGTQNIWISDSTPAGTRLLVQLPSARLTVPFSACDFTAIGDLTYFTADHPTAGREWHRTDGTAAGTFLLVDARNGTAGQDAFSSRPVELAGITYFVADVGVNHAREFVLWQTDGTSAGTRRVQFPAGTLAAPYSNLSGTFQGRLILRTVRDGVPGIFLLDPVTGAAERISLDPSDGLPGSEALVMVGPRLVFPCAESLCASDGVAGGTRLLLPAGTLSDRWGRFGPFALQANLAYFIAMRESQGSRQLWVTDGTPSGTRRVTSFVPQIADGLAIANGSPVFSAADDDRGFELWRVASLLPGAAVLQEPGGPSGSSQPSFSWRAALGTQEYLLWVEDGSGALRIRRWFTASEANCGSGVGICKVSPGVVLPKGSGRWWVQTWNAVGYGPWSAPLSFTIGVVPGAATLLGPSAGTGARPTYTWQAVSAAQEYLLWVDDQAGMNRIRQWVSAAAAGCGSGQGSCSVTPAISLPLGRSRFYVQTWNQLGYGPWSSPMTFYVGGAPGAATLLNPSGVLGTATPTYSWSAIPGAVEYLLWVDDAGAAPRIRLWIHATAAGCGSGTGTCSFTPSTALAMGAGRWWIQTWNPIAYGPWSTPLSFTR